ncbi:MAG: hypothetical protein K9K37_13165 [Desulfocapsa sp.]|nr:hypothetical protein [Desulfocapsa sp.]
MGSLFFCNIGWMNRYEGLKGKPDKIVGGGKYVDENETGHEVCNFLIANDGYVYGHVETIKKDKDRAIRLEAFGGEGDHSSGIDVVWTATDPDNGGRRVVGWYRNATVFRERQTFSRKPSRQHARDNVTTYRIQALGKNVTRLGLDERNLVMGKGPGWMGHTPWWTPPISPSQDIRKFLEQIQNLINGKKGTKNAPSPNRGQVKSKSPSTPTDPYVKYVQAYEVEVTPQHNELQERFEIFLKACGIKDLKSNLGSVDLRFQDSERGLIFVEVKPCQLKNSRYAIRTAMGQLLDYRHRAPEKASMLIVLEVKPKDNDLDLAISNGFGVAYLTQQKFKFVWP